MKEHIFASKNEYDVAISNIMNVSEIYKVKQSRSRPGVTQWVPGI
jgi:chemotaxis signal transduction protein